MKFKNFKTKMNSSDDDIYIDLVLNVQEKCCAEILPKTENIEKASEFGFWFSLITSLVMLVIIISYTAWKMKKCLNRNNNQLVEQVSSNCYLLASHLAFMSVG